MKNMSIENYRNNGKTVLRNYHNDYNNVERLLVLYELPMIKRNKEMISVMDEHKGKLTISFNTEYLLPWDLMEEIAQVWTIMDCRAFGIEPIDQYVPIIFESSIWKHTIDSNYKYEDVQPWINVDYFITNYRISKEYTLALYNEMEHRSDIQNRRMMFYVAAKLKLIIIKLRKRMYEPGGRGFIATKNRFENMSNKNWASKNFC